MEIVQGIFEWVRPAIDWARDPNNSGFAAIIVSILLAVIGWFSGLFKLLWSLLPKRPPKPSPIVHRDDHEAFKRSQQETIRAKNDLIENLQQQIREREEQIAQIRRADTARHAAEIRSLEDQIAALRVQIANPEQAQETRQEFARAVAEDLRREANALDTDKVSAARKALEDGDFALARDLFDRISAEEDLAVQRKARAEFALGEIAEAEVHWRDAANHYARAAELDPSFQHLEKAREFAWRAGNLSRAFATGQQMMALAEGDKLSAAQQATARSEHAHTLRDMGRYEEAEPLYRKAMKIRRAVLGPDHQDYAQSLNNLAALLQSTGRDVEAEPLVREAMEVVRAALGSDHPDYATTLNNLAALLHATGRYEDAEPLYREAMEIRREALGTDHPDYAQSLNNRAALLKATGRRKEAEPLFREALRILETRLGPDHPRTQTVRTHLEGLLASSS